MSELEKLIATAPKHPPRDPMARSLLQIYPVRARILFSFPLLPLVVSLISYVGWSGFHAMFVQIMEVVSPLTGFLTRVLEMPRVHPELASLMQFVVGVDALLSVVAIGLLIALQLSYRHHITPWIAYRFATTPMTYFRRFSGPWFVSTLIAGALILDLLFGGISLSVAQGRHGVTNPSPNTLLFNLGFGACVLILLNLMALMYPLTAMLGASAPKRL